MNALDQELRKLMQKDARDWGRILKLLREGANPNLKDYYQSVTLLQFAVDQGRFDIVKALLQDPRTDPNLGGYEGMTPLHEAVYRQNEPIASLLLSDSRVNPNLRDEDEQTPLGVAVNGENKKLVRLLLSNPRTDPNLRSGKGQFPVLMTAVKKENPEIVRLLLSDPRTDPNLSNKYGETSLLHLGYNWNPEIAELFKNDSRLDLNHQDQDGRTALHEAIANDLDKLVDYLLSNPKVRINIEDRNGATPLILVQEYVVRKDRHDKLIKRLLNDPRLDISKGKTHPEMKKIEEQYPEYVKLLRLQNKLKKIYREYMGLTLSSRSEILRDLFYMMRLLGQHVDIDDEKKIIQDRMEAIEMLLPVIDTIILEFAIGK